MNQQLLDSQSLLKSENIINLSQQNIVQIPIKSIRCEQATQSRVEINRSIVAEYAKDMKNGSVFPPITIFFDNIDYWLADGFHRLQAAKSLERTEIAAEIKKGTKRDAMLYSCGANGTHGLRRTNQDKRRAVLILLEDQEWSQWSNREIARQCGVSLDLVNRLRKKYFSLNDSFSDPCLRTYTTKHGTIATMNTSKIGSLSAKSSLINPEKILDNLEQGLIVDTNISKLQDPKIKRETTPNLERKKVNSTNIDNTSLTIFQQDEINAHEIIVAFINKLDLLNKEQIETVARTMAQYYPEKAQIMVKTILKISEGGDCTVNIENS